MISRTKAQKVLSSSHIYSIFIHVIVSFQLWRATHEKADKVNLKEKKA